MKYIRCAGEGRGHWCESGWKCECIDACIA